jgi:hypothetical protein
MESYHVKIGWGLRIGTWHPGPHYCPTNELHKNAFRPVGIYVGPDLGDHLIGSKLEQELLEGILRFSVGVLFRPDLNNRQRLETILILETWIPEMFKYEQWDELTG